MTMKKRLLLLCLIFVCGLVAGCAVDESGNSANATPRSSPSSPSAPSPAATVSPTPVRETATGGAPLTLPELDAFFADEKFSAALKERLQLSDEQIRKLKELAHVETARLNENSSRSGEGEGAAARAAAA